MAESSAVFATGAWLLTYCMHSTLLLGVMCIVALLLRDRADRCAESGWRIAMFGPIVTTFAQSFWLSSSAPHAGTPLNAKLASDPIAAVAGLSSDWLVLALPSLLAVWLIVAALRVGTLARSHRAMARRLVCRQSISNGVSVSTRIQSPMVIGVREICLPARALTELSAAELKAVLAHETAHLVRHDARWLLLSALVSRVLWFQPLNSIAASRLRVAAERACDDWAVRSSGSADALASALLRVTEWLGAASVEALATGMASKESLAVARVRRILDPSIVRAGPAHVSFHRAAGVLVLSVIVMFAPGASANSFGLAPLSRYTIRAHDDAGPFTLTLEGGHVVGATVHGQVVALDRLRQSAHKVELLTPNGEVGLRVTLTRDGGIRWMSRTP